MLKTALEAIKGASEVIHALKPFLVDVALFVTLVYELFHFAGGMIAGG